MNEPKSETAAEMTPEQMRFALALEMRWKEIHERGTPWLGPDTKDWMGKKDGVKGLKAMDGYRPIPNYAESADAALEIVQMMREQGWKFSANILPKQKWHACFWIHDDKQSGARIFTADHDTLPLAICRAACQALKITL